MTCRRPHGDSDIVAAQLAAALASLLKRGWLESSKVERNAFFEELEYVFSASEGKAPARRAWARILMVRCAHQHCMSIALCNSTQRAAAASVLSNTREDTDLQEGAHIRPLQMQACTHIMPSACCRARCNSTGLQLRMRLVQAVVEEFSPATASMLGLPWDFHERCRAGLEADYLQPMYLHARSVARESATTGLAGQDGGTCQACLALMCATLSWDFR